MKFCMVGARLKCGENHSRIVAAELDIWPLIAGTRQPWQKMSPIFEVDDSCYSHYSSLTELYTAKYLIRRQQTTTRASKHKQVTAT